MLVCYFTLTWEWDANDTVSTMFLNLHFRTFPGPSRYFSRLFLYPDNI